VPWSRGKACVKEKERSATKVRKGVGLEFLCDLERQSVAGKSWDCQVVSATSIYMAGNVTAGTSRRSWLWVSLPGLSNSGLHAL